MSLRYCFRSELQSGRSRREGEREGVREMTSWKSWRKWLLDIPLSARNILENSEPKNGVKDFSNWPTFPQLFIKGEFIGGSDIILNMHKSGELKEKLKDLTAGTSQQKEDSE